LATATPPPAGQGEQGGEEEEEEQGLAALREELRAVQRDVADIRADYDKRRPDMEKRLAALSECLLAYLLIGVCGPIPPSLSHECMYVCPHAPTLTPTDFHQAPSWSGGARRWHGRSGGTSSVSYTHLRAHET